MEVPAAHKRAETEEVTSRRSKARDLLRSRDFFIFYGLLSLFGICTLFYYMGELVDSAGWTALRWDFFYSVHDIHRLFFLVPIIYAAYFYRVKGALIVTFASFIVLFPRALYISDFPNPLLRSTLFIVVAGFVGTLIGMIRNEAEQRRRLQTLVKSERDELLTILENMGDGVCIIGPDYKIRFVNSSMVKEFGEGAGSHCYQYLHKFDGPCGEICELLNVTDRATHRWEYTFPDGKTYEVVSSPFIDSDRTVCQIATFRNITQRKHVERELIELNQLKSDLLSNVSHELKSPLTSIKGIISSLLQKDIELDNETRDILLSGVSEETDRLASLVTNLLNMSKLEAGVWKPDKERCYISDIINNVLQPQKWAHKNHVFEIALEPDLPEIYADHNQIRQVLINLLENAAAYSDEGTKIILKAKRAGSKIEVSVSDQGVGIPQEELKRIFEKFYRGSQKRQKPGGTGLGLAICQAIALSHDGQIWAESEVGRGSIFHFTLPLAQQSNN